MRLQIYGLGADHGELIVACHSSRAAELGEDGVSVDPTAPDLAVQTKTEKLA